MTDERDEELARRLAELDPPAHRADFWSELRADLADSTALASDSDAQLVEDEGAVDSTPVTSGTDAQLVENEGVVELAGRRDRRRFPQHLLVAAAVVLVALVSAGVVLSTGDAGDTDVATDPTVTDPPPGPSTPDTTLAEDGPSTTAATGGLRPVGDPIERGVGRPLGVDPTGTWLYVAAPAPGGGSGCEGAPAEAVFVESVAGDGSDRRLAVDPDLVDATGAVDIRFGGSEIALVPRCEGFGADVVTGVVADDGTVAGPTQLSVPGADRILDLAFDDGSSLVAAVGTAGTDELRLVGFPTTPSELYDLPLDEVVALDTIVGRRLVTVSRDGQVTVDGRKVAGATAPTDVVVSPDGSQVVVAADGSGLLLVEEDAGSVSSLGVGPAAGPLAMPVDGTVVFVRDGSGDLVVAALDLASGKVQDLVATAGGYTAAPDASRIFVARYGNEWDPPTLLEQRLTR